MVEKDLPKNFQMACGFKWSAKKLIKKSMKLKACRGEKVVEDQEVYTQKKILI